MALRACWQQSPEATLCNSLSLALALHFAIAHDAAVINLSLAALNQCDYARARPLCVFTNAISSRASFERFGFRSSSSAVPRIACSGLFSS